MPKYQKCGMRNDHKAGLWDCENRRTFAVEYKFQQQMKEI